MFKSLKFNDILRLASGLFLSGAAFAVRADDSAFLDPPYPQTHRTNPKHFEAVPLARRLELPRASDTVSMIKAQSPVKSQGARGTCSIFSATATAESYLIGVRNKSVNVDLAEEFLEYIAMRNRGSEGSSSVQNFSYIMSHGMPKEESMPYIGETWKQLDHSQLSQERCGHLQTARPRLLTSCLLGHWDPALLFTSTDVLTTQGGALYFPNFAVARDEALRNKSQLFSPTNGLGHQYLRTPTDVKELLARGVAVTLDIDFYYGAWNHREASEYGVERKMNEWDQGIVTAPIIGSLDARVSPQHPAGHSVMLVGYDDDREVTSVFQMTDGTKQTVTFKGVYYFKNSWGQTGFGKDFELEGKNFAGYGLITQDYANSPYGSFHAFYDAPPVDER
jgi:hypothetical protein